VVEEDSEAHPIIAEALAESDEVAIDVHVADTCEAAGRTFGDLRLQARTGMDVLAVQRGGRWQYRPGRGRAVEPGDRILAIGPYEGVRLLRDLCGDERDADEIGLTQD